MLTLEPKLSLLSVVRDLERSGFRRISSTYDYGEHVEYKHPDGRCIHFDLIWDGRLEVPQALSNPCQGCTRGASNCHVCEHGGP